MPDRRSKRAKEQATRLEARLALGKAEKRWREMNGLSQQNAHEWAKAEGVNYFNSQIAYFETARLDPKNEYWYSREAYNLAIANNDFPPTQKGFSRAVLDRLKQAEPFLNIDGEPATAQDFQAMFGARQGINPIYTKQEKLTKEFLTDYIEQLQKTYKLVARQNMMSNKECWEALCKTPPMKEVKEKHIMIMMQDVLRGERVPTLDEARFVIPKYKGCPACFGLAIVSEEPLPKKMEDMHKKLITIVA